MTPAHSDAENLRRLAPTIVAQSRLPRAWVIADNGGDPETLALADELCRTHGWIQLLRLGAASRPVRGAPVVVAFEAGVARLSPAPDVVVKVDADVTPEPAYFERLLEEFARDALLGIASGCRYELGSDRRWRLDPTPHGYAEAQCRAYRCACLAEISPLDRRMGWDTVDEVSARLLGWRTRGFRDFGFRHHRRLGERDGSRFAAWANQGRAAYYLGYRPSYLALRTARRMAGDAAAAGMLAAYVGQRLARPPRANPAVRDYIAEQQRARRVWRTAAEAVGKADHGG